MADRDPYPRAFCRTCDRVVGVTGSAVDARYAKRRHHALYGDEGHDVVVQHGRGPADGD